MMSRFLTLSAAAAALTLAACGPDAPPAEPTPSASADPGMDGAVSASPTPDEPAASAPSEPAPVSTKAPAGGRGGTDDWRRLASPEDASRLGRLEAAWNGALAEADEAGFRSELDGLGALVQPDAALAGRLQPPPGAYRCRTVLIGSNGPGGLAFIPYGWFRCRVDLSPGGDLVLTKTTGSQRPRGLLYPDTERRLVFIGAQAWGSGETGWPDYGDQPDRDYVGVLERFGEERWRLVAPWPRQDARLKIMEIAR